MVDLGGTNFRIGLFNAQTRTLSHVQHHRTAELDSIEQAITAFMEATQYTPEQACLAVASPTQYDHISLTNRNYSFSLKALQARFQFKTLKVINDFAAIAQAVPYLKPNEKVQIGGNNEDPKMPIAVCGPGTGLGVAYLTPHQGSWMAISGEGGHSDFPATNTLEDQILQRLRKRFDRVSAERLLSGSGLTNLHMARMQIEQGVTVSIAPHMITQAALEGDHDCYKSFTLFCAMLGRFSGNLALTFGSVGGVYLSGGILPRYINFLKNSPFRQEFDNKGRFADYMKAIPVFVVTHEQPGLLGAGYFLSEGS